ncbi:uncharacterized protein PG986_000518 [Apiospora aurea]|uniref:Major facilitator superfamily (MFS) profile domain-containing protein n=1 Tax=Apiospora aurea TaxID=335848 RepID=A0ABR1QV94_9PEZI
MNTRTLAKSDREAPAPTETELVEDRPFDGPLKLDKHGLPLVPQPSDSKDDPLNWPALVKHGILLQVSLLTLMGTIGAATINPAFVPLAAAFNITPVQASYELTVWIVFAAVCPVFLVPLANVHGRLPFYVLGNLLAAATNLAAGHCDRWSALLATRAFNGIGAGCAAALGPATVCDLYFLHERGLFMGVYTFCVTNAPHLAPLAGGFIAQNLGWRECFKIPRHSTSARSTTAKPNSIHRSVHLPTSFFRTRKCQNGGRRKLILSSFAAPFVMMRYLSIILPALYYMTAFAYGSLLFGATGSVVFRGFYGFDTAQTGMIISIPLVVGCLLGECSAGWFTDWLVYRAARRNGGVRRPESRLDALWLALLVPVGIIVQGVCISRAERTGWIANAVGMAIASFGLQVAGTVTYTYCTDVSTPPPRAFGSSTRGIKSEANRVWDSFSFFARVKCYKPQAAEISVVLTLFRHIYCGLVPFYAVPLADRIQYQHAWLLFACLNVAFLLPLAILRLYGERFRNSKWQPEPTFHPNI